MSNKKLQTNVKRLAKWLGALLLLIVVYGAIAFFWVDFEPLPTLNPNPSEERSQFARVKQQQVSEEELVSWQTYEDTQRGVRFKYPTGISLHSVNQAIGAQGRWKKKTAVATHFYSESSASDRCISLSGPGDKKYAAQFSDLGPCSESIDRMVLRAGFLPFSRSNVTELGQWFGVDFVNPQTYTIDGVRGYHMLFLGGNCDYDHYAVPDKTGRILKFTFETCKNAKKSIVQYRDAILQTVKLEKS